MLTRTALRRYLIALLYSEVTPQDSECAVGKLWQNCDGMACEVYDSETRQIFVDAESTYALKTNDAAINITIEQASYMQRPGIIAEGVITLQIDIIVNAPGAATRQDICDVIHERVLYRLIAAPQFTNALTLEKMRSPISRAVNNDVSIQSSDDASFSGTYTVRTLLISFVPLSCDLKLNCLTVPLCFEYSLPKVGCAV